MSEEINGWKPPLIYDIANDSKRVATQADIDNLCAISDAYYQLTITHVEMGEVIDALRKRKLGHGS